MTKPKPQLTLKQTPNHPEFQPFHIGQRVYYTGHTSYGRNVINELATIDLISHCICLVLDDSKKCYQDNQGIDVLPNPQRATISVGDLKSGAKTIKSVH